MAGELVTPEPEMTVDEALRVAQLASPAPALAARALRRLSRCSLLLWNTLQAVRDAAGLPASYSVADLPMAVRNLRGASEELGSRDPVVERVRASFLRRSALGIAKYGTTMAREDLSDLEWLRHLQEELMDACVYAQKLIDRASRRNG